MFLNIAFQASNYFCTTSTLLDVIPCELRINQIHCSTNSQPSHSFGFSPPLKLRSVLLSSDKRYQYLATNISRIFSHDG